MKTHRALLHSALLAALITEASAATIEANGSDLSLNNPTAWVGGIAPGSGDTAVFNVAGTYITTAGTSFGWQGITINATEVQLNPGTGSPAAYTISLGAGGISGTQRLTRVGINVTLAVGSTSQTWSTEMGNVQAAITGSATITYSHPSRLWLRGSASGFSGIWRANAGTIFPDTNSQWSGSTGATGQLLNNGGVQLGNSVYDRIRLEMAGNGRLITSGNSTDNGAFSTFTTGAVAGTGDVTGTGDLTITSNNNYGKILINGTSISSTADLLHAGDTIIDNKPAGMTLELGQNSTATFVIGANGVNKRIRGRDAVNSKLIANGRFVLDRNGAAMANGNSWSIVDVATLTESFGANFSIAGFSENTPGVWTLVEGLSTWTFTTSTGVLTLAMPPPILTEVTTTGATTALNLGTTWDDINGIDIVPNATSLADYIPVFDEPGIYTAPANSVFTWKGLQCASGGVELNPGSGGNALTIHLGSDGISGTQSIARLGTGLTLNVGFNHQTWSVELPNVQAAIAGSATITYSHPSRLWLRGANFGFTGNWQADGGIIHPDTNAQWSGSSGATGQLLNHGTIRLGNSAYDRIRLEMVGDGNLQGGGTSCVLNRGNGSDTGAIFGPGNLTLTGTLALAGDLRHTGTIVLSAPPSGTFVTLGTASKRSFSPGANGVINSITGGSPGLSNLHANGTIAFDLSGATVANGNSWTVIDPSTLSLTYGPDFTVDGFTLNSGLWTRTASQATWTFNPASGNLSVAVGSGDYHVNPVTGSDTNPGSAAQPFRTIARAGQSAQPGDIVILRGGTYRETFAPVNSGQFGNPIIFAGYPNEDVIISGYDVVSGWTPEGNGIYQAPVASPAKFHVLINGESAIEARWPNHNSWEILESPRGTVDSASNSGAILAGHDTITDAALPDNLPADWLAGARVAYKDWYRAWSSGTKNITTFNPATKAITVDSMFGYSDAGQAMSSDSFRYELQGSRGLIDVDNEWAYVAATGTLHLQTPGGVDPATLVIESPARDITVNLSGRSHIRLENVRVIGGSIQTDAASAGCVVNGIVMRYATRIHNLTGTGNEISDSEFTDSLEGSMEVKGTRQRLVNNRFHEISGRRRTAYLRGDEHLLAYNSFSRSFDSILSLSATSRCRIVHNDFSEGPLRVTDMGMIYTVFNGGMTEIAFNRFLTDYQKVKHTYGIYLDSGASYYFVHHNVSHINAFGPPKNGLLVFNNTSYRWADYGDGPADPLKRQSERQGTATDFSGSMFLNNLYGYGYHPVPGQPSSHYLDNTYANTGTVFNDTSGLPLDSLTQPENYDFTLKAGSPAIDAGTPISGVTDGFSGTAPDLGAYESGKPAWKAGPDFTNRPVITYAWPADFRVSRYANLLRNGSFDDPLSNATLFPWTTESGHVFRYQSPGWDWPPQDLAYLPFGSMRLDRGACGASQQVLNVEGGRSYAFTLWVRPTSADQTFELGVRLPDQSVASTTGANFFVGTGQWTRMFVSFTLPAGNHTVTAFIRKTSADDNFAYADEAILAESFADVIKPPSTPGATPFVATDDTYTQAGSTADFSRANTLILQETAANGRKPYFKIDLSAHAGRTVQQAILHLYGAADDRLWNVAVKEVTSDWSSTGPNPITAANAPTLGATLATFQAQGSTRNWQPLYAAVDLTNHVNARLAAGGLVNLALDDLDNSGKALAITSSEVTSQTPPHAVSSPRLDIIFSLPPVTANLSVSGGVAAPLMQLSWTASADALNYEIRRATSAGGPFHLVATVIGNNWQDPASVTGTPYFYTVTGTNEAASGPVSPVVAGTVLPVATTVTTTGASFDMSLGGTWDDFLGNDIVPNNTAADLFVPVFDVAGTYAAPAGSAFTWRGLISTASGTFEINPSTAGNAYTIHLGIGGISGTHNIDRLGTGLTLDVGSNNQTWSVELPNVLATIAGSATITYSHPSRLWLRGSNSGFTGIWRADGGIIHPDANAQWSGSSGATGQLLNNGGIRLSSSVYDRIRLEMVGNGRLLTSGNSTDTGAFSTFTAGAGTGTGDVTGTGDLTLTSSSNYGKIVINGTGSSVNADLLHAGDTIIDNKPAGMTLELGPYSTATFVLGANGANHRIRGLDPLNSRLIANGRFIFVRDAAAMADGNSWPIVDAATLTESFGATFSIDGFSETTPGVWTLVEGLNTWTFTTGTGLLTLAIPTPTLTQLTTTGASTAVDLGSTWDDINGIDIVPNGATLADYIPVFDEPGLYTAPADSVFTWKGMQFANGSVELNPATDGNALTVHLGSGGISGTSTPARLGSNLVIDVGNRQQTWTATSTSSWNIQAAVTGTASVTLAANATYSFRGDNRNFMGKWILTSGTLQTTDSNSIGNGGTEIEMATNTTLRLASGSYDTVCTLTGTSANLLCSNGNTVNLGGPVVGGSTSAPKTLNFNVNSGAVASVVNVHGDFGNHVGSMVLARTSTTAPFSVNFSSISILSIQPGAAGIVDGVNTSSSPLIRPGTGSGTTNLSLNGMYMLDLTGAAIQHGNTWSLVNIANLNTTFGTTFTIPGFTKTADTWIRSDGANTWTFSQTTGILSLAVTAPAYASWAAATGLTAGGNDDPALDPDHDGLDNRCEFAFDGNPLTGTASGKIIAKLATLAGSEVFTLTLPVRSGATFSGTTEQVSSPIDGLIYHIQGAEDLTNWNLPVAEVTGPDAAAIQSGLPALSSGWIYRSFHTPGNSPRAFLKSAIE